MLLSFLTNKNQKPNKILVNINQELNLKLLTKRIALIESPGLLLGKERDRLLMTEERDSLLKTELK